jgi:uncharacterized membrane protein
VTRPLRQVFGVPLHPLLVHFPIALWLLVPVLDVATLVAGPDPWKMLALIATLVGSVIGALAIVTGLLEYIDPSLVGIDIRLAARHGVRTSLAWVIFTARAVIVMASGSNAQWFITLCLGLDLIGCALLVQGVLYGSRQVYAQLEKDEQ